MTNEAKNRDAKEYAERVAFERTGVLITLIVIVSLFAAGFYAGLQYAQRFCP